MDDNHTLSRTIWNCNFAPKYIIKVFYSANENIIKNKCIKFYRIFEKKIKNKYQCMKLCVKLYTSNC